MTPELFAPWKKKKADERAASVASQTAERAKNDRLNGRELFMSNASLLIDHAEAWDNYERDENSDNESEANEKTGDPNQNTSSGHSNSNAPSSSGTTNGDEDDVPDDIDDDLDDDELEELEASLSRTSIQIKEKGSSA